MGSVLEDQDFHGQQRRRKGGAGSPNHFRMGALRLRCGHVPFARSPLPPVPRSTTNEITAADPLRLAKI